VEKRKVTGWLFEPKLGELKRQWDVDYVMKKQ
jgi:hypothetical protein